MVDKFGVMWETEKQIEDPTEIWTRFTVQIVNHYTIKHHLCWHYFYSSSVLWLSHTMLLSWFCPVTCGCGSVRQYKGLCLSNLTLHKDCKSFSLSHQIHAPPPLLSSSGLHYPQLSPRLGGRICIDPSVCLWHMARLVGDMESHNRFIICCHI